MSDWYTTLDLYVSVECEEHDLEVVESDIAEAFKSLRQKWGGNVGPVTIRRADR